LAKKVAPVEAEESEKVSSCKLLISMGGIGLLAGILIVFTFQFTLPFIKNNEAAYLEQSIFDVVPDAYTKSVVTVDADNKIIPVENPELTAYKLYPCYDKDKKLVGVAIEAQDQGFQDVVRIIYGYSPQKEAIVGMKVLQSTETPGLGDKIEKDEEFLANFKNLDTKLNENKTSLLKAITLVKSGKKTDNSQISAITGATISSKAVTRMIAKSAEINIPIIEKNLDILKKIE